MTADQNALEWFYNPLTFAAGAPLAKLATLRNNAPVIWVDEHSLPEWPGGKGFWLVLHHADCTAVLKNTQIFSSQLGGTQMRDPDTADDLDYIRQMMLNMDPPRHTRLRRLLINTFTSRAINQLSEQIDKHAVAIVDRVMAAGATGSCDFVKDIAADMPLLCLADIFGLPQQDRYLMFDWANRVIGYQDPDYSQSARFDHSRGTDMAREALKLRPKPDANGVLPNPRSRGGMDDLYRYAHLLAEEKRANPGNDVMSILLTEVDDEEGALTVEEFENLFWLFSVAGNETLRNSIPGGMYALLQSPAVWQSLYKDPTAMPAAVEEMLRWWCPVMNFRRTATEATVLGGENIAAGDKVIVSFLSANYDEQVFDQPLTFNPTRSPNPHLSFGYGPHFCIGAQLARAQMKALFAQLIARMETVELAGEPKFLRSNFQRGVKSLPITWTARQ